MNKLSLLLLSLALLAGSVSAYISGDPCRVGFPSCSYRRRRLEDAIDAVRHRVLYTVYNPDPQFCCFGGSEFDYLLNELDVYGAAQQDTNPDPDWKKIPKGNTQQCVKACDNNGSTFEEIELCESACRCKTDCQSGNPPEDQPNTVITNVCKGKCDAGDATCLDLCEDKCVERCESGYNGYYIPYDLYWEGIGILECILDNNQTACGETAALWEADGFTCDTTVGSQTGTIGDFNCECTESSACLGTGIFTCDYESQTGVVCDSESPSTSPTSTPSVSPSAQPSSTPSALPSATPSVQPSSMPSSTPSASPSATPSVQPSSMPSSTPSLRPSASPSSQPSSVPSSLPSSVPSASPSAGPTVSPSTSPSSMPSVSPSKGPTGSPSVSPSDYPSSSPSVAPSSMPSFFSSAAPEAPLPETLGSGFDYTLFFDGCPDVVGWRYSDGEPNPAYGLPCGLPDGPDDEFDFDCNSQSGRTLTVYQRSTIFVEGGNGQGTVYNLSPGSTNVETGNGKSVSGVTFYFKCPTSP